ncbi:MAG: hypothetical protein AAF697_08140 [Pseudomonadota bacterium]
MRVNSEESLEFADWLFEKYGSWTAVHAEINRRRQLTDEAQRVDKQ